MSNIDCDRSALRLNVTDDVHVCWKIITCPVVCDRSMLIAVIDDVHVCWKIITCPVVCVRELLLYVRVRSEVKLLRFEISIYLYDINRRILKKLCIMSQFACTRAVTGRHAKHVLLMINLSPPGTSIRMKGKV